MLTHKQKVAKILENVAITNHVKPETVEETLTILFKSIRSSMNSPEMPRIIIREFGTFAPSLYHIEKEIKRLEEDLKEGEDEEKQKEAERLRSVALRISEEKSTRQLSGRGSGKVPVSDSDESDVQ